MTAQVPIKLIDCDSHLTEPHDLFVSRAPAKYKDIVPQVKDIDGVPHWVFEGSHILGTTRASSVIVPDGTKRYGAEGLNLKYHEVHKASYDIPERVKMLDKLGIYAAIIYPNLLGFTGGRIPGDLSMKTMICQIYNDAMAEYQEMSGQRLFGQALLPWWDIKECVKEVERAHKMGLRGVNTNPNPHQADMPYLSEDAWTPFFEACTEFNMPINFHIGSSEEGMDWFGSVPWGCLNDDMKLSIGSATIHQTTNAYITNIIMSGVAERFPKVKFVSVESGVGWMPFLLEALDYYYQHEIRLESRKHLTMLPSEYFRRQFFGTFWFEGKFAGGKNLKNAVEILGADSVLWESDFPHPTSLFPNTGEYALASVASLDPADQRKVLSENAAKLYNINID